MKTPGRITVTLVTFLSLYLLGYWFLIKKDWANKLLNDPSNPFSTTSAYIAVCDAYKPIQQLDHYWNVTFLFRRHFTGDWRSPTSGDFVTIGPNKECRFQLGQFAFEGIAGYGFKNRRLAMNFPHQNRRCVFVFELNTASVSFGSSKEASAGVATIFEEPPPLPARPPSHLVRQTPSAPAP